MLIAAITLLVTGGVALTLFGLYGERVWLIGRPCARLGGKFAREVCMGLGVLQLTLAAVLYPSPDSKLDLNTVKIRAKAMPSKPGSLFQDCPDCPEMVLLPPGNFSMGAHDADLERTKEELPAHPIAINYPLAVSRYEVTSAQWRVCVTEGGCRKDVKPSVGPEHPVINVSWQDTQEYLAFLKKKTGAEYRLLNEAEWEYAARGGRNTRYPWGEEMRPNQAGCTDCQTQRKENTTYPVGQFPHNGFNLFDMVGNVREWVNDCWHDDYDYAPKEGHAWTESCSESRRITRGGAWNMSAKDLRVTARGRATWDFTADNLGFRVARVEK